MRLVLRERATRTNVLGLSNLSTMLGRRRQDLDLPPIGSDGGCFSSAPSLSSCDWPSSTKAVRRAERRRLSYSIQANLNAQGHWFVSAFSTARVPDALHPPAWTLLLTVWAWLGQHGWLSQQVLASGRRDPHRRDGRTGRTPDRRRKGRVACGRDRRAVSGFWVYERAILSETLLLLGIAVMILLAYRFRAQPSARLAAVLGIVCGLLALTRSEQILVFVVVVAPLILAVRQIRWRRRIGWLALATLCVLVVVTPWTIYNLGRFQHPVLLSNNFGSAVAQGNCDSTYYGPYTGDYSGEG